MAAEKTYLELSEEGEGSHKFYEVIVDGKKVSIRYGRIGTDGTKSESSYATPEKAKADAAKKIASKKKKGYEEAVMGVRKKRAVTRRTITSRASTSKSAPVLWKFETGRGAFGIFIDDKYCWVGNEDGRIFALDHDGKVQREYKLPDGVKCIVSDGDWLYAGCDDGNVYDLTGKLPYVAYTINPEVDIYWLDIADAVLGVSDDDGNVHVFNHEEESQWHKKSQGASSGWMVRCDEIGVFHGHSKGVTMYDWEDGKKIWHKATKGAVLFGWQDDETVYAGTSQDLIHRFSKKGEEMTKYKCDDSVFSCAAALEGKFVFGGDDSSSVYCFGEDGKRLWKLGTTCGSAYSMQYHNEKLYIVTTNGTLACIDASEAAVKAAEEGNVPKPKDIKAPAQSKKSAQPAARVATTRSAGSGIVVEVYKKGNKLHVRPASEGYKKTWNVQFPKNLREEGAKFVVDELRESARGGFYRAYGDIKKLNS